MNCEEILEDVIAFCKKEIEELEDKTNVDDPTGYDSRNTRRGLRDAYKNVIERIAIKKGRGKMMNVGRVYRHCRGAKRFI